MYRHIYNLPYPLHILLIIITSYFDTDPIDFGLPMDEMLSLIDRLEENSIPLVFSYLYDEFWIVYARLHHILQNTLGSGYLRLPDICKFHAF